MKNKGFLIFIIILLMVILISPKIIKTLKTTQGPREEMEEIKRIETSYNEEILYKKLEKGIVQYWNDSLYFYDTRGNEKWTSYLAINNPLIKTNKDNIYLVDNEKKQLIRMDSKGGIIYRYTFEFPLDNFEISDDNHVILQYPQQNNMTELKVVDKEGRNSSNIVLTEGDVININLSKTHNIIAINTLITHNSLESRLLLYDLNGQLMGSNQIDEKIILDFSYDKKGNIIAITEDEVFSIDKNNDILWTTSINKVKSFGNYLDEFIILYGERSGKNPFIKANGEEDLNIMKYNGKIISKTQVDEEILGLDVDIDGILLRSIRSIYLLDTRGKIILDSKYLNDIKDAFIFPKGYMVVVSKEDLSFLQIN